VHKDPNEWFRLRRVMAGSIIAVELEQPHGKHGNWLNDVGSYGAGVRNGISGDGEMSGTYRRLLRCHKADRHHPSKTSCKCKVSTQTGFSKAGEACKNMLG
jgi:hypothetical protein